MEFRILGPLEVCDGRGEVSSVGLSRVRFSQGPPRRTAGAGLQLLVHALAGPAHGVVLLVARPEHDQGPAFRARSLPRRGGGPACGPSSFVLRRSSRSTA